MTTLTPRSEPDSEQQHTSSRWTTRSCYGCNEKKIRCDKKEPSCAPCTRAGKPCAYPPVGPRKRRTNNKIITDMASRISSLEKSLARAREENASAPRTPETGISIASASVTALHSSVLVEGSREDVLVQAGASSQYFNEVLLSRVIGEEQNIESVLTPHQTESPHPAIPSPFNALGILSSPSLSLAPASFHPPKLLAMKLWKIYVENVEACVGLKVLHLPTDEVKVYSTIDDPGMASLENLALVFAIYFASIVSLDDSEAEVTLRQDKHKLLLQSKVGLEQAFAHADFLDRPTMTGLHALAIYLSALRVHNHGKGIWILNGLVIRIAQSLGLHRDGERLGLSPFQSEIRRRLWWHLLSRDGRAGEDYGLENTNSLFSASTVNLPVNVDDTNLYPEMQQLPAAIESWTAMTFSLINIELTKAMQKIAAAAASSTPSSPPNEDIRVQIIEDLRLNIEKRVAFCNPVVPKQRLTLHCSRFLLRKLDFVTRIQWILLQRSGPHADFATEQNLIEALDIVQPKHDEDEMLKQFAWARKAYPQYHVTMYVLWHLCVKPEGPNVDRAWEAVEVLFSRDLWDETTMGFGSKSAVLLALKAKAESIRGSLRKANLEGSTGPNDRNPDLLPGEELSEGTDLSTYSFGDTAEIEFDLNMGADEWAALVQGFQLDSPGVFWQ